MGKKSATEKFYKEIKTDTTVRLTKPMAMRRKQHVL